MKCNRLISLVKNWYLKVQEESMAPARMVAFMEKHISQCEECLADPDVKQEAEKIREIVLPPSKIPKPKVVRVSKDADVVEDEHEEETSEDEEEGEDSESDDEKEDENDEEEDDDGYDTDLIDDEEI
jgi:hypothetical protein